MFFYGIELSQDAIYDARENAKRLGLDNFVPVQGDVAKVLAEKTFAPASVVIIDPPRSGLTPKAILQILSLDAKKVVYVSCNPITQANDIALFLEKGYSITTIQPIEQFPHTPHVENVVVLQKTDTIFSLSE